MSRYNDAVQAWGSGLVDVVNTSDCIAVSPDPTYVDVEITIPPVGSAPGGVLFLSDPDFVNRANIAFGSQVSTSPYSLAATRDHPSYNATTKLFTTVGDATTSSTAYRLTLTSSTGVVSYLQGTATRRRRSKADSQTYSTLDGACTASDLPLGSPNGSVLVSGAAAVSIDQNGDRVQLESNPSGYGFIARYFFTPAVFGGEGRGVWGVNLPSPYFAISLEQLLAHGLLAAFVNQPLLFTSVGESKFFNGFKVAPQDALFFLMGEAKTLVVKKGSNGVALEITAGRLPPPAAVKTLRVSGIVAMIEDITQPNGPLTIRQVPTLISADYEGPFGALL